jgi:hypothetical protein
VTKCLGGAFREEGVCRLLILPIFLVSAYVFKGIFNLIRSRALAILPPTGLVAWSCILEGGCPRVVVEQASWHRANGCEMVVARIGCSCTRHARRFDLRYEPGARWLLTF